MSAEDLARQLVEELQRTQMTHSAPKEEPQTETQRFRTAMQGMTFGGADEAEAYLRSVLTNADYDETLADVRGKLEKYKGERPWEALGYEVGGAAIPAIAASIFTGGGAGAATAGRMFPTLAKLFRATPTAAKITGLGAVEGAAYGFGTGEGGFANRVSRVPPAATGGAIGGALGYTAGRAGQKVAGDILDFASRKLDGRASKRVEQELARIAKDSGMSIDDVIARVESGDLMAELSPMLQSVARSYKAQSRGAASVLEDVYKTRPAQLRTETMDYLQRTMTDGVDGNVLRTVQQGSEAVKRSAGSEYDDIFRNAPALADDAIEQVKDALSRVPEAGDDVKRIYRAKTGKTPFFSIDKKGNVTFARPPTLEDAEIIRRGINDATSKQVRTGAGAVGSAYRNVEGGLRQAIDDASKPLSEVRAKWSKIERASDAFEAGRKAMGKSPDEVAVEFEQISRQGADAVRAYRSGVATALRSKAATGSGKSLPANIASPERKEGLIMQTVFPEDDLPGLMERAERAARAQSTSNQILGGSQTAITDARMGQTGSGFMEDAVEAGMGNSYAMVRLASQALKAMRPSLSDKEIQRLAGYMVESNPSVLRRALTDTTAVAQVNAAAQKLLQQGALSAGGVGGITVGPTAETFLGQR